MTRPLILAAAAALGLAATGARAQCLALSDGLGGTTVTCPDGRSGQLHTDAAGGVSGMIGTQPYQGTAQAIAPVGEAGAAYLPLPPPPAFGPPPPQEPTPMASLPPLTPQADLTPLQREYQAEQQALRARRAAKPSAPAAAPRPTRRPAGSGPSGETPG